MARPAPPRASLADLRREVERRLDVTLAELAKVVDQPRPAAASLHRLHRDLRRLRVGVEVWRKIANRRARDQLKVYDRRLKHLARLVGGVRDRDVALDLLAQFEKPPDGKERVRLHRLRTQLTDDARTGREVLRMFLTTERGAGLFEAIRSSLNEPASRRKLGHLRQYFDQVRQQGQDAVRDAHRRARRHPSSRRLHRLRQRVRAFRHLSDITSVLDRARPVAAHRPLSSLQRRLGRLHDLDVVSNLAGPEGPHSWAALLAQERRHLRRRLVRQLRKSRPAELVSPADGKA